MAGVNKVILVGNLGRDPELRYTTKGAAVATLSVATTRSFTNAEGEKQEKTEWHRVVVWKKQAEICNQFLSKGRQVYVEGELRTRSWDDNGQKRYSTEIHARDVQFLGSKQAGSGGKSDSGVTDQGESGWAGDDEIPF